MKDTSRHFTQTTAVEAMRMMDEENLSLTEAFEIAAARMAQVQGYEPPHPSDHLAVLQAVESD